MKVKLGDVCDKGSSNLKQSDVINQNGQYPVYGAAGLLGNIDSYHQDKPYVAVVKDGAGIGRVTLQPGYSSVIGTLQYLLPKENVLPEYLYYVTKHMHLEKYYTGATIPHIYFKDYKNEKFNLDAIEKQQRIVDILKKIENIIESRQQELQKLDDLIRARFIELFGDPMTDVSKWSASTIGEQFNVSSGGTPATGEKAYWENGTIPWIGSNMCQDTMLSENDGKFITEEGYAHSSAKRFHKGTVLVALVGATIGKTALLRFDTTTNQNIAAIDVTQNAAFSSEFVFYHMQMLYSKFMEIGSGKFKMANQSFIRQLPLICPPIELQEQFAAFVEQTDKSKLLSGCRLFHSWAPENRDKPKHVGVPRRRTKDLQGGRRQQ